MHSSPKKTYKPSKTKSQEGQLYAGRIIQGLRSVEMIAPPPGLNFRRRPKGSKGKGVAYERKFHEFIKGKFAKPNLGQWLRFFDASGEGFAQPDVFILRPLDVLLFECKLSQKASAWDQMRFLYVPLLEHLFQLPITCVQVCKNLRCDDGTIVLDFQEISDGKTFLWRPL